jgi:hypothetical protein
MFKSDNKKSLDFEYYVSKLMLPPLHRVFVSLISLEKYLYKVLGKGEGENLGKESMEEKRVMEGENKREERERLEEVKGKCGALCRKCIEWEGVDESKCVELNCKVLYIRKRVNELISEKEAIVKKEEQ